MTASRRARAAFFAGSSQRPHPCRILSLCAPNICKPRTSWRSSRRGPASAASSTRASGARAHACCNAGIRAWAFAACHARAAARHPAREPLSGRLSRRLWRRARRSTCDWLASVLSGADLDVAKFHAGMVSSTLAIAALSHTTRACRARLEQCHRSRQIPAMPGPAPPRAQDSDQRRKVLRDWIDGSVDIVVATIGEHHRRARRARRSRSTACCASTHPCVRSACVTRARSRASWAPILRKLALSSSRSKHSGAFTKLVPHALRPQPLEWASTGQTCAGWCTGTCRHQ